MSFCVLGKRRGRGYGLPRVLCALAMTWFLQGVRCKASRVVREADPYTPFTDRIS